MSQHCLLAMKEYKNIFSFREFCCESHYVTFMILPPPIISSLGQQVDRPTQLHLMSGLLFKQQTYHGQGS